MQWLYISEKNEQKIAGEAELFGLANRGTIRPNTLLWSNQLSDWTEASQARPDLFSQSPPPGVRTIPSMGSGRSSARAQTKRTSDVNCRELGKILAQASGWLQLIGVFYCLAFIYILPVFLGIKCFAIASSAKATAKSGDYSQLRKAIKEIKDLFVLQGVFVLIAIVLNILFFIFAFSDV